MKIRSLFFILWLTITGSGISQTSKTDSLTRLIAETADNTKKAQFLLERGKTYPNDQSAKTLADASEARSLFIKSNNKQGQVDALLLIAVVQTRKSQTQLALDTANVALELAKSAGYTLGEARALSSIGRNQVQSGNMAEAEKAYLRSLELLNQTGNESETADIRNLMGIMYFRSSRYQQSLASYDSGIMVASHYNLELLLSHLYMNKANNLTELTRYDEALENHLKSAALKEKLNDEKGMMQLYTNIGNLYSRIKKPEKGVPFFHKSIAVANKLNNKTTLGNNYSNLAVAFIRLNLHPDSVAFYFEKSIENFGLSGDKAGLSMAYHNYGNYLLDLNELLKSEELLNKALALRKQINSKYEIASTLLNLSKLQLAKGNKKLSENMLLEALSLVEDENGQRKAEILMQLSQLYKSTGNYKKALFYHENYSMLKDTIFNENDMVRLKQIEANYEMEKKEAELSREKQDKALQKLIVNRQRNQMIFLFITLLLVISAGMLAFIGYRNKQKYARQLLEKNNQVETLIQELHHRVKNNLQIVSGLLALQSIRTQEETARQVIDEGRTRLDAMALIHQKLYNNDRFTVIDIKDYVENLTNLVAESFGFRNENVSTNVSLENVFLDIDYAIPLGLIVNELVTNAFKHAGGASPSELKIRVELRSKREKHTELIIADNGIGCDDTTFSASKTSFGLTLVNTLVKQLNGKLTRSHQNGTIFSIVFTIN